MKFISVFLFRFVSVYICVQLQNALRVSYHVKTKQLCICCYDRRVSPLFSTVVSSAYIK